MCAIVAAGSMMDLHSRSRSRMRHCGQSDISRAAASAIFTDWASAIRLSTPPPAAENRRDSSGSPPLLGEPDAIASLKRAGRFPRDRPVQFAPTGTSAFTLSGSADETLGADEMLDDERPPRSISMRPLQYAPSSMLIRVALISPTTDASFLISTRS